MQITKTIRRHIQKWAKSKEAARSLRELGKAIEKSRWKDERRPPINMNVVINR